MNSKITVEETIRFKPLEDPSAEISFGFYPFELNLMIRIISDIVALKRVLIFGSRSMGNFQEGSDVDLAIEGKQIDRQTLLRLKARLEETFFPLSFDIIHYDTIDNSSLREHIDQWGIELTSLALKGVKRSSGKSNG